MNVLFGHIYHSVSICWRFSKCQPVLVVGDMEVKEGIKNLKVWGVPRQHMNKQLSTY